MDRKTVFIIGLVIGLFIMGIYAFVPSVGAAITFYVTLFAVGCVDFVMFAPWQFTAGLAIASATAIMMVKGFFKALRWGNKATTRTQQVYQTQPVYQTTQTIPAPTIAPTTTVVPPATVVQPALEKKD